MRNSTAPAADRTLQRLELESWAIPTSCSGITARHVKACGTSTSICRIGLTIQQAVEAWQVCSCLFNLQPLQQCPISMFSSVFVAHSLLQPQPSSCPRLPTYPFMCGRQRLATFKANESKFAGVLNSSPCCLLQVHAVPAMKGSWCITNLASALRFSSCLSPRAHRWASWTY